MVKPTLQLCFTCPITRILTALLHPSASLQDGCSRVTTVVLIALVTIIPHVFGTHCMNKSIVVSRYGVASSQYLTEACLQLLI